MNDAPPVRTVVVERDIADPVLVSTFGHDGQQFYVVARTFPNLQDADGHVDRLKYRARRVLFPALVAHRRPKYEAIAKKYGYTVDARRAEAVTNEDDFLKLVATVLA